ncbi:transmembrane protein 45B-like [Neltuma alba]|uniref:transmembrane protein 45B-like n=1 Tax=Neltuma alba TaxID=207710 RepID=UPI0010A3313B|nr:transmembrane protein 45B-like [Prosopis alba]
MDGHVALGFGFIIVGLWHLFNHIKLHAISPMSYNYCTTFWFPTRKFKYLELIFIMVSSSIFIAMELFISPSHHQPFDPDGSIPSTHLHNLEHSSMSLTFFIYASFAIALDLTSSKAQRELTQLLAAIAFAQQLFLIHFHTSDHNGPEGQYHLLAQFLVLVSLTTTLIGIGLPSSFLVSFLRSVSIMFQGVWLMVMGFVLWTPGLIPKGCFMNPEEGHVVVRCSNEEALRRALSLVNIQFSWFFIGVAVFAVSFYMVLVKYYQGKLAYGRLAVDPPNDDIEFQKKSIQLVGNVVTH